MLLHLRLISYFSRPMSILDKIETSTATYYIEDDILFMRKKQDADLTLEASVEGVEIRKKLQNGKPMLTVIDTRKVFQVSREAREYGARKEVEELSIAMAIIPGTSLAATIVGNFFIKFNKPTVPTRIFKSEEKALEWLKSYK